MKNISKISLIVSLIMIMGIGSVSALLDTSSPINLEKGAKYTFNDKEIAYNPLWEKYAPIKIESWYGLPLISSTTAEAYIDTHTESCGIDCSSTIVLKTYGKSPLIDDVRFYTLNGEKRTEQPIRSYQFYIKTNEEEYSVDDYEYVCTPTGEININGTEEQSCENKLVGSHTENKPLWETYNIGTEVPAGVYEVKLEGEKSPSRSVDWVIKTQGIFIEDWAVWGGNMTYDEIEGTVINQTLWGNTTTNGGTTTASGGAYTISVTGTTTTRTGTIKSINLPSLDNINNLSTRIYLQIPDGTADGMTVKSSFTAFGTEIYALNTHAYIGGYGISDTSVWSFIRNYSVVNKYDVYNDGVWNQSIIASDTNISIYSSAYVGAGSTVASSSIYYVYYFTPAYVTLNSPSNNYISPSNSVDFNCSATVTGGATLTNMSLWTNSSGTMSLNQSINLGIQSLEINASAFVVYSGDETGSKGFKFITNTSQITVSGITKFASQTASTCAIFDSSHTVKIVNGTFSGNSCALTPTTLNASTTYYAVIEITGASYRSTSIIPNSYFTVLNGTQTDWSDDIKSTHGIQNITLGGLTSSTQIFTSSLSQPTLWTCQACDSDGDCGFASENRTVSVDSSSPSISIVRPTATEDIGYANGNQNLSWVITDTNFDSAWFNYNGTNVSLNGATNSTTFQLDGSDRSLTFYANDSVGNVNSTEVNWNYTIFVNSQTYNTSTYETSSETFSTNATGATSANLIYDGTSYTATQSGTTWSKTIQIPTIVALVNKTFYWNFQSGINTTGINQSVAFANFSICGGVGGDVPFLNFSFKDESDSSVQNASNDLTSITYWLGDGTVTKSYTFQNTTVNYQYTFCATPNKTFNADISFKYSTTTYPLRTFTYDNAVLTNSTTQTTLYMLSSTEGIYSAIRASEISGAGISGVTIQYERQIGGLWTLLGQEITGDDGVATFWVNPNYQYRFTATKTGYTTSQVTIQPSQTQYTIIMSTESGTGEYTSNLNGLRWTAHPGSGSLVAQSNQVFNATVTAFYSDLENCKLEILNSSNISQILASVTSITNSSYCAPSLTYTTTKNSNLFGRLSVDTNSTSGFVIVDADWKWILIDINNSKPWFGITGFFSDVKDLSEWGTGNEAEFSRIIMFFLITTIFIGIFIFFSGVEITNPGLSAIIVWAIVLFASMGGFLTFESGSSNLAAPIRQYGFFFIYSLLICGYVLGMIRRTGD